MAELQERAEVALSLPSDAWRLRCLICGGADWKHEGTDSKRIVFQCRKCSEFFQVDVSEATKA